MALVSYHLRDKILVRSMDHVVRVYSDDERSKTKQYSIREVYQSTREARHDTKQHSIIHRFPMEEEYKIENGNRQACTEFTYL